MNFWVKFFPEDFKAEILGKQKPNRQNPCDEPYEPAINLGT